MTYSYLVTIPAIFVFTCGTTIVKYREGWVQHPELGVIPKPRQMWSEGHQRTTFPLVLTFSFGWALEMVTHLEELCFWLFLVNSGSSQRNWFQSFYFKAWLAGSAVAIVYMPLITILTRGDMMKAQAYTFLGGSLGDLSLTVWFVPILWTFPGFLKNLRREGVDVATVVRLTTFSELNMIRVLFRFMFTVPLLILGIDGVTANFPINKSVFNSDLLVIMGGFGCAISSALTLVIFFPRSIEGEIAARDAVRERKRVQSQGLNTMDAAVASQPAMSQYGDSKARASSTGGTYLLTSSPVKTTFGAQSMDDHGGIVGAQIDQKWADGDSEHDALPPLRPNRRRGGDIELAGVGHSSDAVLTESNLSIHNMRYTNLNPAINNFTSPIEFAYTTAHPGGYNRNDNSSRLTFNRK